MAHIMRNRAGHSPNRGQALRLKELPLSFLQAVSHANEGCSNLRQFIFPMDIQWIGKITLSQSAHSLYQFFQRTGKAAEDRKGQETFAKQGCDAQGHKRPIQAAKARGSYVVRFQNTQIDAGLSTRSQLHRSGQVELISQLKVPSIESFRP